MFTPLFSIRSIQFLTNRVQILCKVQSTAPENPTLRDQLTKEINVRP